MRNRSQVGSSRRKVIALVGVVPVVSLLEVMVASIHETVVVPSLKIVIWIEGVRAPPPPHHPFR